MKSLDGGHAERFYPCSGESCLIQCVPALGMLPTVYSCGVVASAIPCSLALLEMVGWSWLLLLGMRAGIHSVLMVLLVPVHEGSPLGELLAVSGRVKVNVHIRTFKGLRKRLYRLPTLHLTSSGIW